LAHNHDSAHAHHHHGTMKLEQVNRSFIVGIALNLLYVIVQVVVGLRINSLSLLSDAGHNFLDVAGLALSLLAFKLANFKESDKYTYGYKKSSILVALINAVLLLVSISAIAYSAVLRFSHPEPLPGKTISLIAGLGIFVNGFSAFMFFREKGKDINVQSAFLHLAADALVSLAIVIGGIVIYYTGEYWIDPALSLLVCAVIVFSTWRLLKDSVRLSLDGVPQDVSIEKIKNAALHTKGINGIHHVHVWALSSTENAMTAHIIVNDNATMQEIAAIKEDFKHHMLHENIQHVTLETETATACCVDEKC